MEGIAAGYNINLGGLEGRDNEAMLEAGEANADFHLLMTVPNGGMNGAGEIQQIGRWKAAMPSRTNLIWRTYLVTDGDWIATLGFTGENRASKMMSLTDDQFQKHVDGWAETQAKRWHSEGHLDVWRDDPDNEPKLQGASPEILKRYVISRVALIRACKRYGVKVAIGAFSVGIPNEGDIDAGIFDPILREADYLSVHEYPHAVPGCGDLPFVGYDTSLTPETLWNKIPKQFWKVAAIYFLLRRVDRLVLKARQLGNTGIGVIITETSVVEDIPDAAVFKEELRKRYGKGECGGDLRGVQAWTEYHKVVFNSDDINQNVATMIEYMLQYIYNLDYILGLCFFGLNRLWGEGDKGKNRCHNYFNRQYDPLRKVIIPRLNAVSIARGRIMTLESTPSLPDLPPNFSWDMTETTVKNVVASVNIRDSYTVNGKRLGSIKQEYRAKVSKNYVDNQGYRWHRIEFINAFNDAVTYAAKGNLKDGELEDRYLIFGFEDDTRPLPPIEEPTDETPAFQLKPLPEGWDWAMQIAAITFNNAVLRKSWSDDDSMDNAIQTMNGKYQLYVSFHTFEAHGYHWHRVALADGTIGYVAKPNVTIKHETYPDKDETSDETPTSTEEQIEAAVEKHLSENLPRLLITHLPDKTTDLPRTALPGIANLFRLVANVLLLLANLLDEKYQQATEQP